MKDPCANNLPALKSLGSLSEIRPTVAVDNREQQPLKFTRLPSTKATLYTADYSFIGGELLFGVERKTVSDLIGCVTNARDRFEKELNRMRGLRFKRLLVIGSKAEIERGNFRSKVAPRAVLSSLSAWECRFDVPVVFSPNPIEAALTVESWVYWAAREICQAANTLLRAHKLTNKEQAFNEKD